MEWAYIALGQSSTAHSCIIDLTTHTAVSQDLNRAGSTNQITATDCCEWCVSLLYNNSGILQTTVRLWGALLIEACSSIYVQPDWHPCTCPLLSFTHTHTRTYVHTQTASCLETWHLPGWAAFLCLYIHRPGISFGKSTHYLLYIVCGDELWRGVHN